MARVLLDENLDRRLAAAFVGHTVSTVPRMGWAGLSDAAILERCDGNFEFFVTGDRSLRFQNDLSTRQFGVLVLSGATNRLADLLGLVPAALQAMESLRPGQTAEIGES